MDDAEGAIEALEQLGLTEYEARCFVALTRLPHGTAKEVGKVADIPRSRVYETMDRLQDRGLVDIQKGDPRRFRACR
jgi:sugar-specific transcriptional regulator TrmB